MEEKPRRGLRNFRSGGSEGYGHSLRFITVGTQSYPEFILWLCHAQRFSLVFHGNGWRDMPNWSITHSDGKATRRTSRSTARTRYRWYLVCSPQHLSRKFHLEIAGRQETTPLVSLRHVEPSRPCEIYK